MNNEQIETITKLRDMAYNNELGAYVDNGCIYHDVLTGRRCAVGALLNSEQLKSADLWGSAVDVLEHLELYDLGGFTPGQLNVIQAWHDAVALWKDTPRHTRDAMLGTLFDWMLDRESFELNTTPFLPYTGNVEF